MLGMVGGVLVRGWQGEGGVQVGVQGGGRVPPVEAQVVHGLLELGGTSALTAVRLPAAVQGLRGVQVVGCVRVSGVRGGVRGVEPVQVDSVDVGADVMLGGGVMSSATRRIPAPIAALPLSRSGPTTAPDMDLAELANQVLQFRQEVGIV